MEITYILNVILQYGSVRLGLGRKAASTDNADVLVSYLVHPGLLGWLGSRVVSALDPGAEGPGFKSQPRHCRVTVLGKLFTPIVPVFTEQRNW